MGVYSYLYSTDVFRYAQHRGHAPQVCCSSHRHSFWCVGWQQFLCSAVLSHRHQAISFQNPFIYFKLRNVFSTKILCFTSLASPSLENACSIIKHCKLLYFEGKNQYAENWNMLQNVAQLQTVLITMPVANRGYTVTKEKKQSSTPQATPRYAMCSRQKKASQNYLFFFTSLWWTMPWPPL
jgi:hypothetical protein